MIRALLGPRALAVGAAIVGLVMLSAAPAHAQTGQVKGKVVDAQGNPVDGATVQIDFVGELTRHHETKTNKRGDFVQIGLQSGRYKITVSKDNMVAAQETQIRIGNMSEVNFVLQPSAGGPTMTKEEADKLKAKIEGATAAFEEAVALSQAGKDDEAIAKFTEVVGAIEKCGECYVNIGAIYARQKKYDEAEKAFKTAIDQNPSLPDAFNGLANVYNAQRKFDEAAKASAEANKLQQQAGTGGGDATTLFNQGVILWNSGKGPEAKAQFEEALKVDPNHADAHFMLGKVFISLGQFKEAVDEFETYLKLAPSGANAKEAQSNVDQLKPLIK